MHVAVIGWFEDLALGPAAVLVIGGFVLLSLLLARVVRALVPNDLLREHNELAGFIFAVIGVIYAVVLGFRRRGRMGAICGRRGPHLRRGEQRHRGLSRCGFVQ